MLATSGDCIKLWDINDFKLQQIFPSKLGLAVQSVSWNNDGGCLGSFARGSAEVSLRAIRDSSSLELPPIKTGSIVYAVDYAHKAANYLAVAESSGKVVVWDSKHLAPKKSFQLKGEPLTDIAFSPSDSHLAVSSEAGDVRLLSLTSNTVTGPHRITKEKGGAMRLSYSSVRRDLLGVACWNGAVRCLDCNTGKVSRLAQVHTAPCGAFAFSPINELLLVSAGYDKKLAFYNVNSFKIAQMVHCDAPLTAVAFLPGGLKVCVGTQEGQAAVHDLRSLRQPLHSWSAHSGPLLSLAPRPTPTGSLRRRKPTSCSRTLNKSLPDNSPQAAPTHHANPMPTPRSETSISSEPVASSLHHLTEDILSPVRKSSSNVYSNAKVSASASSSFLKASEFSQSVALNSTLPASGSFDLTTTAPSGVTSGPFGLVTAGSSDLKTSGLCNKTFSGTTYGRTGLQMVGEDGNKAHKNQVSSHASQQDLSVAEGYNMDTAFDPDDILSPVRTANEDDKVLASPWPHRGTKASVGCSPALSAKRDDSIRSSLLRMAAGEPNFTGTKSQMSSPQSVASRESTSKSSPSRSVNRASASGSSPVRSMNQEPAPVSSSLRSVGQEPATISSPVRSMNQEPASVSSSHSSGQEPVPVPSPLRSLNQEPSLESSSCSLGQEPTSLSSAISSLNQEPATKHPRELTSKNESATSANLPEQPDSPAGAIQVNESESEAATDADFSAGMKRNVQMSETPRTNLLPRENEVEPSPAPSLPSLSDDLFSPVRACATTPSASLLSSKKISDRLAVIEDLINSKSPSHTRLSITNNSRCDNTSSMSPHNKENVPSVTPLSPSFDPPSSKNAAVNDRKISSPRIGTRGGENLDKKGHEVSKNSPLIERKNEKITAPRSPSSVRRLQKNYDKIVSKMKQMELLAETTSTAAVAANSTSTAVNSDDNSDRTSAGQSNIATAPANAPAAVTSESLTLSLVQNCVADALEEFEASVNRRFMHLHYTLLTTLVQQTREIEELHKKYSLNEELLEENLRLQEEIRYLRANY